MPLLNHLGRRLHVLRHAQPRHDDGQTPTRECADGQFVLDGAELGGRFEDAHVVEFVEQEFFVFAADGVLGRQEGEAVGELAEGLGRGEVSVSVCRWGWVRG